MNQIKQNFILFCKSIFVIALRDITIQLRNLSDIISYIVFFIIITLIFIFSIGPSDEQLKPIGISILWSILVLSSSISVSKILKEDYEDGNFAIYQFSGLSLEMISFVKIITSWILYQFPVLFFIPLLSFILNIDFEKLYLLIITMLIGSPILTIFTLISSAMMLTNKKNLILGSLVVLPLSIPVIIFAVGAIHSDLELFYAQVYILISILLAALALGPWIISGCIKIAIRS